MANRNSSGTKGVKGLSRGAERLRDGLFGPARDREVPRSAARVGCAVFRKGTEGRRPRERAQVPEVEGPSEWGHCRRPAGVEVNERGTV